MVRCKLCQRQFKRITHFHLESRHNVTLDEYRIMFPEAELESLEWRKAQSNGHLGQAAWNKGLDRTDSRVAQYANSLTGKVRSLEHCQHISEAKKGSCPIAGWNKGQKMQFSPERSLAISKALKGRNITWGDKISKVKKEQCKDPEYALKLVSSIPAGSNLVRPTKPEQKLMAILDEHFPGQWKYVGDGEFTLGRLVPDFMNINGKKQLIEVYGEYWHRNDDPQDKVDRFKQFGFATIVFWESELNNTELVLSRIANFPSVETLYEPSQVDEEKVRHS